MASVPSERAVLHEGLAAAFGRVARAGDGGRAERRPGYFFLVSPLTPAIPQSNGVWGADGDDDAAAAELEQAVAEVEALGLPFWLQTREGRHPALEAQAARIGLELADAVPGMVAGRDDLAPLTEVRVDVRRVEDDDGLATALSVAAAGFAVPPAMLAPFYRREVAGLPGMSVYVGTVDGAPVSTALAFATGDGVGVFNVATPPEHRRRGYGAALTARAVADGFAAGARVAWLQSSSAGESVYRRIGFRHVETYRLFTRAA